MDYCLLGESYFQSFRPHSCCFLEFPIWLVFLFISLQKESFIIVKEKIAQIFSLRNQTSLMRESKTEVLELRRKSLRRIDFKQNNLKQIDNRIKKDVYTHH